jgi:deoxyribose-phosphate aldolase
MAHPKYTYQQVAKTIDHSLLKPEMTRNEVKEGCARLPRSTMWHRFAVNHQMLSFVQIY